MSDTAMIGDWIWRGGTTMHEGSISIWLARFRGPNREQAAAALWNAYALRLLALARRVLGTTQQRTHDAEDIVQEVFGAFFRAVEAGRYSGVANWAELWRLLGEITRNRVADYLRGEARAKRVGRRQWGESVVGSKASNPEGLEELADDAGHGWEFDLECAEFCIRWNLNCER
jgi:DNA-directed RNA polymerase specialized sigma24 family protein